jgi:hypothetical protein
MAFVNNIITNIWDKPKNLVSVLELKRLLVDLRQKRQDICFRYRLVGEMWIVNAMRVMSVIEKGVLLNDEQNNKLVTISDLSMIMQFEIDAPFQGFQPHFHYHVKPMPDFVLE